MVRMLRTGWIQRSATGAALAALLLASCSSGGSGGPKPKPQNLVTLLGTTCANGVGNLPNTRCLQVRVETVGNPAMTAELRVIEPNPAVPYIGTVVVCSGTGGSEFFSALAGGEELLGDLTDIGLRVIDRRWPSGWFSSFNKLRPQSQRLAELLDWVAANEHQGGLFFAVGSSGGAAELAYTLTTWDTESLLDTVVLAGGPAFSRLDYLCLPAVPAWSALCPGFLPTLGCGTPPCTAPASNGFCATLSASATQAELLDDSVLFPGADTDFGSTEVHFIVGSDDCTDWIPQAFLFESEVASAHTLQVVPHTGHTVSGSPAGRDSIVQALLGFTPAPLEALPPRWALRVQLLQDGQPAGELHATGTDSR